MQSQQGSCCSWACVVPALALPEGFVGSQAMPMLMLAPMTAPVMTSMSAVDSFLPQQPTYAAPVAFSWPMQDPWPQRAENMMCEAPLNAADVYQWSLCDSTSQADPLKFVEGVPTQVHMDSTMLPQATDHAWSWMPEDTVDEMSALRHRQNRGSAQNSQALVDYSQYAEKTHVGEETEAHLDAAQAKEIARNFLAQLQSESEVGTSTLASFERLAFTNTTTSRAAQIVLKEASVADAAALAKVLRGCVRDAVQSKHANHVVQQIIEIMPVSHATFIVEELKGFGHEVARHPFGCRVLCRILEHLRPQDDNALELVEEALADVQELCSHEFGSFVARHLLEYGTPDHKHCVAVALGSDLVQYSKHKLGSHVVESALRLCSREDQYALVSQLISDRQQLLAVVANQYGRHVGRALLEMPGDLRKKVVDALLPMEQKLKSSRYGKSILAPLRAAAKF